MTKHEDELRQEKRDEKAAAHEEQQRAATRADIAERQKAVDKSAAELAHDQLMADLNSIIDSGEADHMVMLKKLIERIRKPA